MKWFKRADYYDYNLIGVIILLMGFGLVMLYSTTAYTAEVRNSSDMYYLKRQAVFSAASMVLAIVISLVDYHILWRFSKMIYIISLVLMVLVKSPLGKNSHGAQRWLRLGPLTFQPAELAKIAVIVFLPVMIIRSGKAFREWREWIKPLIAGLVQAAAAMVFTDNLSTAIIIMLIAFGVVFIAHPRTLPFLLIAAGTLLLAAVLILLISRGHLDLGFRSDRILAWINPDEHTSETGYQVMQGLYAIGSGGILGKGLGNSVQKMGAVPEAQNDMIFSIICEELGIFGGIIVILLFIYLLYRLFYIAQNAPDLYGSLMVSGVFIHVATQVVLNLSVVLRVIPTTGITLPFLSYGGTSLMLLMMEIAIALSVSFRIRSRHQERDLWGEVVRDTDRGRLNTNRR